jgi:hypothetical protein
MTKPPPIKLVNSPEPPDEECDRILGAYLRAWNQIEHALEALFTKLVDNQAASYIVFHGVNDVGALRRIIEALAKARLKTRDQKTTATLMEQVENATRRRNRLVHGQWMMMISIHRDKAGIERARTAKWVRAYIPVDLELWAEMQKNAKVRQQHQYNVQQIANITDETRKLARKISAFAEALSLLPYFPPQPINIPEPPDASG